MVKKYDKLTVLRAMCLYSATQGGLKKEQFDVIRRAFIINYGYHELVTLMNLQDAGLIKAHDAAKKWDWNKIKTELQLINEEFNPRVPTDISFVHNGFAPMSIRLIERLLEKKSLALLMKQEGARLGLNESNCKIPMNEARFFNNDQEGGRPR